MKEAFSLDGQVALVTGASRGIGAAIAEVLLEAGARVAGTATTPEGALRLQERLAATYGERVLGLCLDVTDAAGCEAAVAKLAEHWGAVTILVNNAGITRDALAVRMSDEDWEQVLQTNLSAVFRLSRLVLRSMMRARYGRIINLSSVVASMGNAGQANYAAAKAGVEGMTRALAREVGSRNITVNCVAPGFIETDMTAKLSAEQRAELMRTVALQRLGTAREVAYAVHFLASPAAAYITGATLHINGGMYMA